MTPVLTVSEVLCCSFICEDDLEFLSSKISAPLEHLTVQVESLLSVSLLSSMESDYDAEAGGVTMNILRGSYMCHLLIGYQMSLCSNLLKYLRRGTIRLYFIN